MPSFSSTSIWLNVVSPLPAGRIDASRPNSVAVCRTTLVQAAGQGPGILYVEHHPGGFEASGPGPARGAPALGRLVCRVRQA
jgi:hypothetical protein